jgi:hypothetical protein
LWRRIKRKTKKRKIRNGLGGFKIQKITMEEKYINFYKMFDKRFKNNHLLLNYYCTQPSYKILRDNNIKIEHNYSDKNGNYIFSVFTGNTGCSEEEITK